MNASQFIERTSYKFKLSKVVNICQKLSKVVKTMRNSGLITDVQTETQVHMLSYTLQLKIELKILNFT